MQRQTIIQTKNLTKKIGNQMIIDDLSINVKEGEIYGFLGPNGAGKSTTMKLLLGLERFDSGDIRIFNQALSSNLNNTLTKIGSLIEEPSYYPNLTGQENLEIVQKLMNLPTKNIDEALKIVRLTEHKDKLVKNYSLGMKQRLGIALSIVKFPRLLILDEPTNGLDPSGIQEIRELIKTLPRDYGMTVMISSHILSEIEQMATTVGIISHGKLLYEGAISGLEQAGRIEISAGDLEQALQALKSNHFQGKIAKGCLELADVSKEEVARMIRILVREGIDVYQVQNRKKTLEEIFLEMTNDGNGVL
jgi:ABC-2 type transport system ATP-binding protein